MLWARQDVRHRTTGISLFQHPQAGPLELHFEKLAIPGTDGQTLVTYQAQPGSASEERILLLASLNASASTDGRSASDGVDEAGLTLPA